MDFKEMFIAEHERIQSELEEQGMDPGEAYDVAADRAYDAARDRFADAADQARQRAKDEGRS